MTDTELILNRLDGMQEEITKMHAEISDIHAEMNDMHAEISGIHAEMNDMHAEISGIHAEMDDMHAEIRGIHAEMNDMHAEISGIHTEMDDMRTELGGKIEAVRLSVMDVRDKMDTMEFALQTEISKTYDLAQENSRKINRLLLYNGKVVPLPIS